MSKLKYSIIIITAILIGIVVYSSMMFLLVTHRTPVFYISYGFTVFSFLVLLGALLSTLIKPQTVDTAFLHEPYVSIAFLYAIAQLVFGVWAISYDDASFRVTLSIDILFCGLYLICLLFLVAGISLNKEIEQHIGQKRTFLMGLQRELANIIPSSSKVQKALDDFAEDVKYSDPMSHVNDEGIEAKIIEGIKELSLCIDDENVALNKLSQLQILLKKRNDAIKYL